jgi:hypothetical protein
MPHWVCDGRRLVGNHVQTVRIVSLMKLPALGLLLAASLLVPAEAARASGQAAEFECTVDGGTRQVASLLAAFSSGKESRVRALIARPVLGRDGLELAPTFAAFAQSSTAASHSNLQVHTQSQLRAFMRAMGGHRFKVLGSGGNTGTNLRSGEGAWTGEAVSLEVAWRARGGGPAMNGHKYVSGSSKDPRRMSVREDRASTVQPERVRSQPAVFPRQREPTADAMTGEMHGRESVSARQYGRIDRRIREPALPV